MKVLILSFEDSEEDILREILSGIRNRTGEYQIWDCVLDNDIHYGVKGQRGVLWRIEPN